MSYTFIKKSQFGHKEDDRVLAISQEIETLRLSETYGEFGQTVGTYNTGDSIELLSKKAVEVAQKIADEQEAEYKFEVGDIINGYDNSDVFNDIWLAVTVSCTEIEDYQEYFLTCKGFDYWDGSNWKTVTVEAEVGETSHEIVTDGVSKMSEAIENMSFVKEGHGKEVYESEDYWIVESFYSEAFEKYSLYPKADFDLDQVK